MHYFIVTNFQKSPSAGSSLHIGALKLRDSAKLRFFILIMIKSKKSVMTSFQ